MGENKVSHVIHVRGFLCGPSWPFPIQNAKRLSLCVCVIDKSKKPDSVDRGIFTQIPVDGIFSFLVIETRVGVVSKSSKKKKLTQKEKRLISKPSPSCAFLVNLQRKASSVWCLTEQTLIKRKKCRLAILC